MNSIEFGLKVKRRREEINLTQADLAIAMGLDQGKISLIERGLRKVDCLSELPVLSIALRCPLSYFYTNQEEKFTDQMEMEKSLIREIFPWNCFNTEDMQRLLTYLRNSASLYVYSDPLLCQKVASGAAQTGTAGSGFTPAEILFNPAIRNTSGFAA